MPDRMHSFSNRTSRSLACLVLGAGVTAVAADGASTYTARIIGGAWFAQLGGDLSYDGELQEGSTFGADDFDLDEASASPMVELGLNLPILFDLHAGYAGYGADGSETFTTPKLFNDQVIAGEATAEVDVEDVYGEVMWRFLNLELGGAGVGLAVHYIDAQMSIDSQSGSERFDERFPMPALSGRAFLNPWGGLSAEMKLHLMSIEVDDVDAQYVDFHVLVGYRPIEWVGVELGYRFIKYDFDISFDDEEHLNLDLSLSGPFLGAVLQF